jgi:hypothetical protein
MNIMPFILDDVVGYCTVTLRNKELLYITSLIKLLLNKRDRLKRGGRISEAEIPSKNFGQHS